MLTVGALTLETKGLIETVARARLVVTHSLHAVTVSCGPVAVELPGRHPRY